jgi:hypothetical protein
MRALDPGFGPSLMPSPFYVAREFSRSVVSLFESRFFAFGTEVQCPLQEGFGVVSLDDVQRPL